MQKYQRRSIRLHGYDYSQPGSYFITVCTLDKAPLLGEIAEGEMVLNAIGKIVEKCWLAIPDHFANIELDKFVVMPNHIHGIISIYPLNNDINNTVGVQNFEPLQNKYQHIIPKSVGSIIRAFKIGVTKWVHKNTNMHNVWQRNYYEHIIRDEPELNRIRRYIINNPPKWEFDRKNRNGIPIGEKEEFWCKFLNEW